MPRGPRLDAPGTLHHVIARGIAGAAIFLDDADREDFLDRIGELAERGAFVVYAWALVGNHFHLLLRTASHPLPRAMRSLLTGYAGRFNRRHERAGHLFQNRYKSIVCDEEAYFLELVRYIHLNPLRAKLVDSIVELADFPFGGHSSVLHRRLRPWHAVEEVLDRFGSVASYRRFIADGAARDSVDLEGGGLVRSAGGWEEVKRLRRGREEYAYDERILGDARFVDATRKRWALRSISDTRSNGIDAREVIRRVSARYGVDPAAIEAGDRSRKCARARDAIAFLWLELLGRAARDLSLKLKIRSSSLYRGARRARAGGHDLEQLASVLHQTVTKCRNVP